MTENWIQRWISVLPLIGILAAMPTWVIWRIVEFRFYLSRAGRMKRGVKVWVESLPTDMKLFLRSIPDNSTYRSAGAFLKKCNNAVLVQPYPIQMWLGMRMRRGAGGFPYVAYIDLGARKPKVQYRLPASSLAFYVLWMAMIIYASMQDLRVTIFVLLGAFLFVVRHLYQRKMIFELIRKCMRIDQTQLPSG
jgi:hypothetical protein